MPSFLRRRRNLHLTSKVFRAEPRLRELISSRQKVLLILSVLIIATLLGLMFFSGFFTIQKIVVERSSLELPVETIEKSIRDLALNQNIFLVDKSAIKAKIQELYPDIARVDVSRQLPATLQIVIFKFPIVAELRMGTERIFLNEKGYRVYDTTPDRDTLQLVLGEELDLSDSSKPIVSTGYMQTIKAAANYFSTLTKLEILNLKYLPTARELHLKAEGNFDIWLDLNRDYKGQLNKLIQAQDLLDLTNKQYEYIDLRIPKQVFYKEKK